MIFETLLATFILGIVPIVNKYIIKFINIDTLLLTSTLFLFVVSFLYMFFSSEKKNIYKDLMNIQKNKYLYLLIFITSIFVFIANYLYLFVLNKNSAFIVTAIIASNPIITAIFGYFLLKENISFKNFIGMIGIITGVILLTN